MPQVRMSDVAREANVSLATVVRVVHNNGYVSEKSRESVENAIKRLGYIPNRIAQGLKNKSSRLIGHVLPFSYKNPFFAQIGAALDKAVNNAGYHVLTVISQSDADREAILVDDLVGHMADGIVFTSDTTVKPEMLEWLVKREIPTVMIERSGNTPGIDRVLADNAAGSYAAASYIIGKGHKRIGFIGVKSTSNTEYDSVENDRFIGYRKALADNGIAVDEKLVRFVGDYTGECGYDAAKGLLSEDFPPTALLMASDLFASGALQYFYEAGIRVPDDISIVGYDNTLSAQLSPPVTSVAYPMNEIGEAAMQMIIERSTGGRRFSKTVTMSPFLIDRDSVKVLT